MKIAISPCPNDTFLFHAWITGLIDKPPQVHFADIQELNQLALKGAYPLIKLSFHCLSKVTENYQLLPVGSALGFNCGPKIIAKSPFSIADLPHKRIAIPGKETTAHLLLEKLLPSPKEKHFCLYHEVIDLIEKNSVDCGLIIHETRFTYTLRGFYEIIDLGKLWEMRYHLPLPLGGLVIRRDFQDKERVVNTLKASLAYAQKYPKASRSFILNHSQEKESDVVERHIATYVNQETESLSIRGMQAIELLTGVCLKNSLFLPREEKPTPHYAG